MNNYLITTNQAIDRLKSDQVGIIPTDTIYGLAAPATNQAAVQRLYALKHREHKPGTLIAANVDQLKDLGVPASLLSKIGDLWPNPLSIILPIGEAYAYLHQGVGDLAIRVPANPSVHAMLERTGPLITSSANHPGEPSSMTVEQAWNYFGSSVDFYVDGGDISGNLASTIIRFTPDGNIEVLRQGAFTL